MSQKTNTTRRETLGAVTLGDTQLVITDTPGTTRRRPCVSRRRNLPAFLPGSHISPLPASSHALAKASSARPACAPAARHPASPARGAPPPPPTCCSSSSTRTGRRRMPTPASSTSLLRSLPSSRKPATPRLQARREECARARARTVPARSAGVRWRPSPLLPQHISPARFPFPCAPPERRRRPSRPASAALRRRPAASGRPRPEQDRPPSQAPKRPHFLGGV